jgi:ATP-dependent Clp protease ATP-binding subunit ClpC
MYERFTDDARQTMVLALREARRSGREDVGTEHVLLGLIDQPECVAATILRALRLDLTTVRMEAENGAVGFQNSATVKDHPLPRAKVVLDLAIEEANNLGHDYVDTRHLLVGLIRERDGVAGRILRDSGIFPEAVRKHVGGCLSS